MTPLDQEDKQRHVERYLRQARHHRSPEEQKRIAQEARRRKATRRAPRRTREDDDEIEFETMRSRRPAAAADPGPRLEADKGVDRILASAQVVGLAATRARLALPDGDRIAVLPAGLGVAVGDHVAFESVDELLLVRSVLPRRTVLARPDPAGADRRLVLAANVDVVACVVAARSPRWRPGFVDRVLLAVEEGGAEPLVVVAKLDLVPEGEREALDRELDSFRAIGVPVVLVSAPSGAGLAELRREIAGRSVVFVGPSGVGKSTLQNVLDPSSGRATGPVRDSDGKGRHTTTASELSVLADGTRLIDTPGVRQFGLAGIDRAALASYFPEFAGPAQGCRFRDCAHLVEPDCGVRAAVEDGRVPRRRFEAYARIRTTLES